MGQVDEKMLFMDTVTLRSVVLPADCVTDAKIPAGAGLTALKLQHQHRKTFTQPNTTATATTETMHVVHGATGLTIAFEAGSIVACTGNATITVDLKKNGTTVLTAPITLDSANTAYIVEAGAISVPALVDGDVLTIVVAVNAGTGALGTGLFAELTVHEDAQ